MQYPLTSTNQILAKLPPCDRMRLWQQVQRVTLDPGEVICDPGRPPAHAYFPNEGVLSCLVILENGHPVEVATIGNEGMASVALLVDAASPHRVVQQVPGEAVRIPAAAFQSALAEIKPLQELVERYALSLIQQCSQNVACNTHHGLAKRIRRWLLASSDRAGKEEFHLTQEFLSQMLGVRRQTVGLAAQSLQRKGLISYRRGRLKILDRAALEEEACECYRVTKDAYNRIMRLSPQSGLMR